MKIRVRVVFPGAILSNQCDLLLPSEDEVDPFEYRLLVVCFAETGGFDAHLSRSRCRRKTETNVGFVCGIHFNPFEFVQFFNQGLSKGRLIFFGAKFIDQDFGVLNVFLLVFVCLLLSRALLLTPYLVFREA